MLATVVVLSGVIVVNIVLVSVVTAGEVAWMVLKTVVGCAGVAFAATVVDNNRTGVLFGCSFVVVGVDVEP